MTLLPFSFLLKAQTISLGTDNEYCPNTEYEFTVTLPGPYKSISATQMLITQQPYAFNTSNTSFKFKAKFNDVNIKQFVQIRYNNNDYFTPEYKKVKSLFYNNDISCSLIQPKFTSNNNPATSFTAPLCQVSNFSITFNKIKWHTAFENPIYCFGSISDYEYLLPAGWKIGATTSNGTSWIQGTNSVTITSDLSTGNGSTILIRPKNTCITPSANGQIPVQIFINRPQGFAVTPANVPITCGSTTPVTFTINNLNNVSGITDYTWNLGATPNGWLLPNGNPAPASYSTGTVNTLTLTPVCGIAQSNVSASVTVSGTNCNASTSTVTLAPPMISISGNTALCSGSSDYTLNNVPCNASVTWNASPASGIISLFPNGNSVTAIKTGNGGVILTAAISACNNYVANLGINVGAPESPAGIYSIDGTTNFCVGGGPYGFEILGPAGDPLGYTWIDYGPTQTSYYYNQGDNMQLSFSESGTHTIAVIANNSCGGSAAATTNIDVAAACGWGFSASPNPAGSDVEVALDESTLRNNKSMTIREIRISDKMGNTIKQVKNAAGVKRQVISVSQWQPGLYYIRVFNGKEWKSKSIIKQ